MDAEQQQDQQYAAAAGQSEQVGPDPAEPVAAQQAASTQPAQTGVPTPEPAVSPVAPVPPAAPPVAPRRPRIRVPRVKMRYALLALALIVAGTLAAAYFLYWQNPARVLGAAVTKTTSARSLHYDGGVKFKGEIDKESKGEISGNVTYRGDYDGQNAGNPKLTFALGGNVGLGVTGIGEYEGELEGRYLDKTFYGAMTKATKNEAIDLEGFTNLWVKFPEEKTGEKPFSDYVKPLSNEDNGKLKAAFKKHKVVSKLTAEKDERVEGVPSRHFKVTLDYKQLKELAPEVASIFSKQSLDDKQKQEIRDAIIEPKTITPIDVWVSKQDGTIRKVSSHDEADTYTSDSTLIISKVNQPVSITAPEKSLTAEELEKESTNDADKDGLVDLAERYFKTNPKNPDSDGDTFKDGTEVGRGFDPAGPGKLSEQERSLYGLLSPPPGNEIPRRAEPRDPVLET